MCNIIYHTTIYLKMCYFKFYSLIKLFEKTLNLLVFQVASINNRKMIKSESITEKGKAFHVFIVFYTTGKDTGGRWKIIGSPSSLYPCSNQSVVKNKLK